MASGKTTFGKALAQYVGRPFIDLDLYIEEKKGATVTEIFAKEGENGFRELERDLLREVAKIPNVIISCGGGTPCFFDNIDFINTVGISVYLDTTIPTLVSRLNDANANRPLVAGLSEEEITETVKLQLEKRIPYYSKSKIHWTGEYLETAEQIENNIECFIKNNRFVFSESFL